MLLARWCTHLTGVTGALKNNEGDKYFMYSPVINNARYLNSALLAHPSHMYYWVMGCKVVSNQCNSLRFLSMVSVLPVPPMLVPHTLHWLSISSWRGDHSGPCYPKSTGETTKLQKMKPLYHLTCPMNGWGLPLPASTDLNKYLLKELDSPSVINQCVMSLENSLIKSLFQVTQMKFCGFVCWHTYEHYALEILRWGNVGIAAPVTSQVVENLYPLLTQ